jgi:TM2 domain-containing membrane protein YozV
MEIGTDKVYCFSCGEVIKAEAEICPACGVRQKIKPLYQMKTNVQPMKNPGIAAVASFFFAGLGQIYNGEIGKGLILILVQTMNLFLMILVIGFFTYPIVWIYGIYDAYKTAEKINAEIVQ